MREAVIILPRTSAVATQRLKENLLSRFDGYTVHHAYGAWRDKDGALYLDENNVFTVAADDQDGHCMLDIRDIAMEVGRIADQISVYVRGFDGEVEFVNCSHSEV